MLEYAMLGGWLVDSISKPIGRACQMDRRYRVTSNLAVMKYKHRIKHITVESLLVPVSQQIRSPRKSDPGRIRYASNIDSTLADSIQGINSVVGFTLLTSQSKLWCTHADLT